MSHYTVYFSASLLLSSKITIHTLHQSICLLCQRAVTVIGCSVSKLDIDRWDCTVGSLRQINGHAAVTFDLTALTAQSVYEACPQRIVLLPVRCHRFHALDAVRHGNVKAPFVVVQTISIPV